MILESSCITPSHPACNSLLVHSAAHLPLESMAKLPPLHGSPMPASFQTTSSAVQHSQGQSSVSTPCAQWKSLDSPRICIAVHSFRPNHRRSSSAAASGTSGTIKSRNSTSASWATHSLEFTIGDVIVIVEHCSGTQWYRGHREGVPEKLGIFPANYVQLFDHELSEASRDDSNSDSYSSYYYTLLDPLYLQVVRTLREWHSHLVAFYRSNINIEKYQLVRKLMCELIEICEGPFGRELAPNLWRRRCAQILKGASSSNSTKDPFVKLYLDEDNNPCVNAADQEQGSKSVLEPSLEELYDKILSKLNHGNQLLNLDIMPSFTHGTFSSDHNNSNTATSLLRRNGSLTAQYWNAQLWQSSRRNKFRPYFARENSKYLTSILDYYNRLGRKFSAKQMKSPASQQKTSLSFHSPLHLSNSQSPHHNHHPQSGSSGQSSSGSSSHKKYRRHLLFSIREANFSSLFSGLADSEQNQPPLLQIDVHVLRANNTSASGEHGVYQVLTEKYCYRVRASGQSLVSGGRCQAWANSNRALFLDVLSKKGNGIVAGGGSTNRGSHFFSQQSDSANYYLVIQVWRYGKMLLNESRTKNMLSATMSSASASLSSGTSVFHTISSSSISSATAAVAAAASTTSLSSLTSFVSNSTLFGTDKSTASSTPDSSSIDSSELGAAGSFKRSVGFAVVPLLELVSRDQELKPNADLLRDESVISRVLLADESMLLSVPIKLYEGDLTSSALEAILKYRQQSTSISTNTLAFSSASNSSASSTASISKLSPLSSNYQLIVCAKFISELLAPSPTSPSNVATNLSKIPIGSGLSNGTGVEVSHPSSNTTSLADWLLLNQCSTGTLTHSKSDHSMGGYASKSLNFIVVQKRAFGAGLITAGYFRNDFYLTLEWAEFEKGGKAIPKNIEVSICLITENGIQERAISSGANDEPVTFYRSHIQYHQNSPKWFEHVKINVPLELFESAHLRFTFCHCSSKERDRKFVGFSFLPLAEQNGACLADGEHELYIYKCDSERKLDDVSYYLSVPWGSNERMSAATSGHSSSTSSIASSAASTSSTSLAATSSLINSRSSKEVFHVRTNLVSSKLTQNSDILLLLKWSCTPLDQVYDALARIGRVPGEEIVKFLEDILDALFTLFTTSSGSLDSSPQMTIIFRVLVDFFKTLNDPKFASYRAALEAYIENQFSAPLVHPGLMACVKKYIELVIISFQTDSNGSPPSLSGVTKRELEFILRCLSVFDWILKIIVQSRILYTQASANGLLLEGGSLELQTCDDFRGEIFSLFQSINRLLSVESKSSDDYLIIAIQESVLSTLPNAFSYLSKILSPLELSKLVKSIVNSNGKCSEWSPLSSLSTTPTNSHQSSSSKKTIISAKLSLLQETIRCQHVWSNDEARLELLDTFIRLLNVCITESRNCLSILHDIILYLIQNSHTNCKVKLNQTSSKEQPLRKSHICEREIEMLSFGAIDAIVEHIIELTGVVTSGSSFDLVPFNSSFKRSFSTTSRTDDDQDYLGSYIMCFMVLLDFMSLSHYEKLFETRSTRQCKELLIHIFMVFLNALYYFNDSWLEVKMAVNRIILQSLSSLRSIMSQEFLAPPDKFDITIWRTYFKLSIAFLTQARLQFEPTVPYWKRRFILDTYGGDMRIAMGHELVTCWNSLGPSKISFIPSLVCSFVDVTLVPVLELRRATLPLFFDMLAVDFETNGNFKQVESALIDKLDALSYKPECDIQYRELFAKIMTTQIESHKPVWYLDGHQLVKSVSRLLSLLIDYRAELKCKQLQQSGLSRCQAVNEVDDSLLMCTYTLLRFYRDEIDSYNCKTIMLRYVDKLASLHTVLGNYTEAAFTLKLHADQLSWSQSEAAKKESLYETMLSYFERGQCWEEGLRVCKDLQEIYEHNYKFGKLSTILKRNADLLDKILSQHRPESEYFRVSFYGLDFRSFLQNSTFIFRGHEFEKISNFTHRIQQEFPNATLLTKNIPSDESITESYSQYIQIFAVKPMPEPPVSSDQSLIFGPPDNVLSYYQSNFVRQFVQDRPIQRPPFDSSNEFKSLWIERTVYTTEKPLPGILRTFKVVSTHVTYLSPIENACETIENMNNELSKLIATYSGEQSRPESISPLSMRLQGILEAAVNGGIAKYIDAFLGSEFLSANPDQVSSVTLLKNRIAAQIKIVESGLTLHGRLAPIPVRPLHTRLLERFGTMRNTVNQANIETSQALLWTPNLNSSTPNRPSILSQPLPPIPPSILGHQQNHHSQQHHFHHHPHHHPIHRHDNSSDPETSSLSSSSSTHNAPTSSHESGNSKATPPLQPPPLPPPLSASILTQSPSGKSLKSKPLPPLPPLEQETSPPLPTTPNGHHHKMPYGAPMSAGPHQRHNSTSFEHSTALFRSKSKQHLPMDDSIYAVPQLPDITMDCGGATFERGSSVDDDASLDYYDDESTPPNGHTTNGHRTQQHHSRTVPRSIYRSRSIPRSSISQWNNGNGVGGHSGAEAPLLPPLQRGQSNANLAELADDYDEHGLDQIDHGTPPPLPPRTGINLDRSNSLNSAVRSSPLIPPLIPPALPQRRVRKSSSTSNSSYPSSAATVISATTTTNSSIFSTPTKAPPRTPPEAESVSNQTYLSNIDGIEFENLVISSPTPRSESSHQSSRPAPIIGIEIDDTEIDLFPATPLITTTDGLNSTFMESSKIVEHRSKSSSLPRMQQFALNLDSSTSATTITKTTMLEHFESRMVSSMTSTSTTVITTNGSGRSLHNRSSSTDSPCETKSSLFD